MGYVIAENIDSTTTESSETLLKGLNYTGKEYVNVHIKLTGTIEGTIQGKVENSDDWADLYTFDDSLANSQGCIAKQIATFPLYRVVYVSGSGTINKITVEY